MKRVNNSPNTIEEDISRIKGKTFIVHDITPDMVWLRDPTKEEFDIFIRRYQYLRIVDGYGCA